MISREERGQTILEELLKDEDDPVHGEFNKRWNEQLRKDYGAPRNIASPFGPGSIAEEKQVYEELIAEKRANNFFDMLDEAVGGEPNMPAAKGILNEVFEKSNFYNTEFNLPGATRAVTGSQMLENIERIVLDTNIGTVAGYSPDQRVMVMNPRLLSQMDANEVATTMAHEVIHSGAHVSGSLDAEKLNTAVGAGARMTPEQAAYIGQQEGIADAYSRRTF